MATHISTVSGEEVQYLIAKLDRAAAQLPFVSPDDVPLEDLSPISDKRQDHAPAKHIQQIESIANHLASRNLLRPSNNYCELGCGTAKLSDHISLQTQGASSHFLVDRKSFKNTRLRDWAMQARRNNSTTIRFQMDIREIHDLCKLCKADNLVAISKHLCGPATDFSIHCCLPSQIPMAFATCCHYLCEWNTFCNRKFFRVLGFTERDFEVLTIVSQWASLQKNNDQELTTTLSLSEWLELPTLKELPRDIVLNNMIPSEEFESTFSRQAKAALGKRCKLILDMARLYRLDECGYSVKLVRYTVYSVEDHLILALRSK